jgi:hypothetical protein
VVCLLWVRSYWRAASLSVVQFHMGPAPDYRRRSATCSRGSIEISETAKDMFWDNPFQTFPANGWSLEQSAPITIASGPLGFRWYDENPPKGSTGPRVLYRSRGLVIPCWSVAAVAAVLPAAHLRRLLRARRHQGDLRCRACGYDLRATPDRCPECGTVARQR